MGGCERVISLQIQSLQLYASRLDFTTCYNSAVNSRRATIYREILTVLKQPPTKEATIYRRNLAVAGLYRHHYISIYALGCV